MNNKKTYTNIKHVTWMPCFLLKIQGKLDSRKGNSVAEARIDKLKDRCAAIENKECLNTEKALFVVRKQAAAALAALSSAKANASRVSEHHNPSNTYEIRENQRLASRKRASENEAASQLTNLYQVREIVTHGDTNLAERILKTRKKALVKIDAYVKGLRAGELPSFEPDLDFCDDASSEYHSRHNEIDNAIRRLASYEKEVVA